MAPDERRIVHNAADRLDLWHISRGTGDQRQVYVSKTAPATNQLVKTEAGASLAGTTRALASSQYHAATDNELSIRAGEIVTIVHESDLRWWSVTNEAGDGGLVPSDCLLKIDDESDDEAEEETRLPEHLEFSPPDAIDSPMGPAEGLSYRLRGRSTRNRGI